MAKNKRLIEDLQGLRDWLREQAKAGSVPAPGGGKRVFIDPVNCDKGADTVGQAIEEIKNA